MRCPLSLAWLPLSLALGCASLHHHPKAAARPAPDPKFALQQYRLGIDAYSNSRYAEAIRHWRQAQGMDPHLPRVQEYINRARSMIKNLHDLDEVSDAQ